jgi:hypothetical protein
MVAVTITFSDRFRCCTAVQSGSIKGERDMSRFLSVFFFFGLSLSSMPLAADSPVVRLSEPVKVESGAETFGGEVPTGTEPHALADVVADAGKFVDRDVIVSARIGQVCRKKGCFFIARDGDVVVRVTFKDYGFFIPTDAGGKRAVFVGVLKRETVSGEQADHYAADLGDTDAPQIAAGPAYTFVAEAIRIEG